MGDTTTTIIAIFLAAILMFIFPLMAMSDRTDDISQLSVQTATTEFVDDIRTTGVITLDNYDKFVQTISSTGNAYDVSMEVKVLDENPGKKATQSASKVIGENVSYSLYTSQIMSELEQNDKYTLKEGDYVAVSVTNTNSTIAQQLKNAFYKVTGNDTYSIAASHGGIVAVTGK
jgi:surface antigen